MRRLWSLLLALVFVWPAFADELEVEVEEPVAGAEVTTLTCQVRVRVSGAEVTGVEVMRERKRGREPKLVTALQPLEDGRWGGEVRPREGYFVLVRDAQGREARVPFPEVVDRSGWVGGPEILAPGAALIGEATPVTDLEGAELELVSETPTLVVFYSAWNDCEQELEWIRRVRKKYAGRALRVIGVGSVAADDVEAWRAWLAEREVDWANVVDADGSIGKRFYIQPRKVVGNAAVGPILYLLVEDRVMGGDFVDRDYLLDPSMQLMINEAMDMHLGR